MSASDSELLRRLLDIEEIKRLKARYFRTLDHKDWGGFARVFARNAVLEVPEAGMVEHGRDAIVAAVSGALIGTCTVPSTGGPQTWAVTSCAVTGATGIHDLYLTFAGVTPFNVDYWQFAPVLPEGGAPGGAGPGGDAPSGDAAGGAGPGAAAAGTGSVAVGSGSAAAAPAPRRDRKGCVLGAGSRGSGAPAALLLGLWLALRARRRDAAA